MSPNTGWKLDAITLRVLTDLDHCDIKRSEVACAESGSTLFVESDVLEVFNPRRLTEESSSLEQSLGLPAYLVGRNTLRHTLIQLISTARRLPQPELLNFSLRQDVKTRKELLRQFSPFLNRKRQSFSTDCFGVHTLNSSIDH